MPETRTVVETKEVKIPPPDNYLTSCNHPIPILNEDGTLSNINIYNWVSDYQKVLEDCNDKIKSIKAFYKE